MEGPFRKRIFEKAFERNSRIILAFDKHGGLDEVAGELSRFCSLLVEHLAAVKIGWPTILSTGLNKLKELIENFKEEHVFICDAKMADISHTNSLMAKLFYEAGFDAIIAHGFIGYEDGLEGLFREAREFGGGVIIVVGMSHVGSMEFIDPNAERLTRLALEHGADGVVAPATKTIILERVRRIAGEGLLVLAPGVGVQGAPYGAGLSSGADFEIIGRSIVNSPNPVEKVLEVKREHGRILARGAR